MTDTLDPVALEKARWTFAWLLRTGGYFGTPVGECPVFAVRDALEAAIRAYLAAIAIPEKVTSDD